MNAIKRGLRLMIKKPDFGWLVSAQFLGQAGDGIVQAALAKLIVFGNQKGFDLEEARDPEELLRIVLYIFVPYTILSPFLGVIIDRWDRRRLLFVTNGFRALVIALVGIVGTDTVGDLPLFLAFLLTLSITRVMLATKAAALPSTTEGENLVEANAVSQLGGALFQIGGAGAAVIATESLEAEPVVVVGALVYAAAAALVLRIRSTGEPRPASTWGKEIARVVSNIVAGLREVARKPQAGAAITTYFWLRFLWSFTIVGIAFVLREKIGDDEDLQALAIVGIPGAAGAVLGFIFANRLHTRAATSARLVLASSTTAGLAVLVLGGLDAKPTLGALTFFLGLGFFLGKISLDTMVQQALGDDFRGRAFSLYDIAYNLAWVVAATIMKLFWTDVEGPLIAAMGGVFLIGLGFIGAWFRSSGLLRLVTPEARA